MTRDEMLREHRLLMVSDMASARSDDAPHGSHKLHPTEAEVDKKE